MKEQWIEDISAKLDGYEMDAPEVSWSEVHDRVRANRRARTIRLWRKRIAVAASALIVAAVSTTLFFTRDEESALHRATTASDAPIAHLKEKYVTTSPNDRKAVYDKIYKNTSGNVRGNVSPNARESYEMPQASPEERQDIQQKEEDTQTPSNKDKQGKKRTTIEPLDNYDMTTMKKRDPRLLASAYFGNGVNIASGVGSPSFNPNVQSDALMDYCNGDRFLIASHNEKPVRRADHHQPIRIGLSLRYAFNSRWGVETGLVYSYLKSDITEERHAYTVNSKQKVGYVGLPLAVSCNVAKVNALHFYVAAGTMVEIPITAKTDETIISNGIKTATERRNLPKSALQLSLSGKVGAEYLLTPSLGIYAEPGVSYYFDNGSNIETAYSDKPFNVNLNMGVRLTIK